MSRRRYISTLVSTDKRLNLLARDYGDFAALLYTWMVPHADDRGILNGDLDELMAAVMPMRRDRSTEDVERALSGMVALELIQWDGRIVAFPPASFYRHQSYIKEPSRRLEPLDLPTAENAVNHWETPENAEEPSEAAQNAVSFSFSSSLSSPISSANAECAPTKSAPRSRKAKPELIPLTAEQIDVLAEKYADLPEVRDKIALALEHPAHEKYPLGQFRYVNNWLATERARLPNRGGNGNGRTWRGNEPSVGARRSVTDELRAAGVIVE